MLSKKDANSILRALKDLGPGKFSYDPEWDILYINGSRPKACIEKKNGRFVCKYDNEGIFSGLIVKGTNVIPKRS